AGNVAGRSPNMRWSAAGPPVEVAIATMLLDGADSPAPVGEVGRAGGAPAGALGALYRLGAGSGQRRTTLTCDMALTVSTRARATASKPGVPSAGNLGSAVSAPARSACMAVVTLLGSIVDEMI